MLEKGVKELRDHFTTYLKKVKKGEEIIVTERGKPIALLKPMAEGKSLQEKLEVASIKGLIQLPLKKEHPHTHTKVKLSGKSLTDIIIKDRETQW